MAVAEIGRLLRGFRTPQIRTAQETPAIPARRLAKLVVGAALLSGVLRTQLYEMAPLQPVTFASIAVFVMLIAMLAMLSPARRAGKASALRE